MRILLVDDHVLFREGLVSLLEDQAGLVIVGEAGSVREAISKAGELHPDLVLMDIGLPDGSGLEAAKAILSEWPDTKIVILTMHESDDLLFAGIRIGVKGYLLKDTPMPKFLAALQALLRGEAIFSRAAMGRILDEFARLAAIYDADQSDLENISTREMEVLELLGNGATNRQIAERLGIAENTVKIHVRNILDKLKLRDRLDAARFARRQGFARQESESLSEDS